jgi:alkylation response protein AidB-like acyl-CoA dehydrogenase
VTQLALAPEVEQLREVVRSFCRDRLSPAAGDAENRRLIPAHLIRALNELGILSPLDSDTDQVLDPVAMVVIAEELGAGDPGVAYETISGAHAALAISQIGSDAQRTSIIDRGPSGAVPLGSLWFYEGFGRGPDEYLTTIERTGDQLTLDGRKTAVVRPGTADFAVVIGRCSDRAMAVALDRQDMSRCDIDRDDRATGKLGLNAAHTGNIRLAGVRVPATAVLAAGSELAVDRLVASARMSTAAIAVGVGTAAVRYAADYATTREAFGQRISAYQGVSFPLAEADMGLNYARSAILDLAVRLSEATDPVALARETGQVVAAATKATLAATVTGVNTLGGHGFLADYPVERWYRAAGTLAAIDDDPLLFGF